MRPCIILPNGNITIGVHQYCPTISVYVEIVRRRKYGDHRRKLFGPRFAEHNISVDERKNGAVALDLNAIIPGILCFMSSDDTVEVVPLQELDNCFVPAIQLNVSHRVHRLNERATSRIVE